MGYVSLGNDAYNKLKKPAPPGVFDAYGGAIKQTGSDYDEMMGNYKNILKSPNGGQPMSAASPIQHTPITAEKQNAPTAVNFTPNAIPPSILFNPASASGTGGGTGNYTPVTGPSNVQFNPTGTNTTTYNQSGDTTTALKQLQELAETGGYSEQNKNDIRARGISPIRSIYSSAQRGLDRSKSLSGGYSPNYAAASAKMAREQAGQISGATTKVNADLAQSVAQNRLSAAPAYASASADESARRTGVDTRNSDIRNQVEQYNRTGQSQTDQFNADLAAKIAIANSQGQNDHNRLNLGKTDDVNKFNASGALDAAKFNTSTAADVAMANTKGKFETDKFNVEGANDVAKFNAGAVNDAAATNAANRFKTDQTNFDNSFKTNAYNNGLISENNARQDAAAKGMNSLYGTTPALASTFGDQALKQQQLAEQQRQFDIQEANRRQAAMKPPVRN